jgi:FkbM family methyltransferase
MRSLREMLKSNPLVQAAVRQTKGRYHRWRRDPARHINKALHGSHQVFVVQIGSNDGSTADPIHSLLTSNLSWRALLVEPVPYLFERLKRNYPRNARFRFDNVAVGEVAGVSPFYYLDPAAGESVPGLPYFYEQVGSFNRNHITKHFGSGLDKFIVKSDIPTAPLSTVLKRNNVTKIDLFHIDAEGYDWIILRQLDLNYYAPKVILFEHKHLSLEARLEACAFLRPAYKVTDLGGDYFCRRVAPAGVGMTQQRQRPC